MDGITSLQGTGSPTDIKAGVAGPDLGKEDFLNLLVTQLKNQDPLNPSDPTEFTAQLAQYSSLEQLYNIGDSMKSFDTLQDGFGRLSALSLIDKEVIAESDSFRFQGSDIGMGFRFNDPMEKATVYIKSENGGIVDQITLDRPTSGENYLRWDGNNSIGGKAPEGKYTFSVIGTTVDGDEVEGATIAARRVTGVDFSDSGNKLLTEDGAIDLSEVIRVNNPTSSNDES